jgi:hypothetical protein
MKEFVIRDGLIVYSFKGETLWECEASDIICFAEYTDVNGPYADDYFFVFITRNSDQLFDLYTASFYSEGRDALLDYLGELWGFEVRLGLVDSTDWKSRVLYPQRLADQSFYEFREVRETEFLKRLKSWFVPTVEMFFSDEVKNLLRGLA